MHIDRKQILESFLGNLYRISSKEYQKKIWIEGRGPEVQDFDEAVCDFFGDGDPILKKYKDFGLTETQYQFLKKFRNEFQAFADKNSSPEEFIESPEWQRIMDMAKETLKAFDYKAHKYP